MTTKTTSRTKVRLTNKLVDTLVNLPPSERRRRYWDTECTDFFLQFSQKGVASYVMRFTRANGTDGEFSIGEAKHLSADAARAACKAHISAFILNGVDPVQARRDARAAANDKEDTTFKGVAEAYIARKAKIREAKGKTRKLAEVDVLRRLVYPLIGSIEITKINQNRIEEALEDIELGVAKRAHPAAQDGRTTSVAAHKAIKRVWKYAIAKEIAVRNPAAFKCADDTPAKRRGRLDDRRFKLIWDQMLAGYKNSKRAVTPLAELIYMTTLQRPVDVARAARSEIDLASRTWRPTDTKTGAEYFVPLSDLAIELIKEAMTLSDSPWLFPKMNRNDGGHLLETSLGLYWHTLRKRMFEEGLIETDDINQYDCRRFGRTRLAHELGFSRDVAELVINHHQKSTMAGLYDVYDYEPDIRKAQEAWGAEIVRICGIDLTTIFDD